MPHLHFFSCPKFLVRKTCLTFSFSCPGFLVSKKMPHLHFFSSRIFGKQKKCLVFIFPCPGFFRWLGGTLSEKKTLTFLFFCPGFLVSKNNAALSFFLVQDCLAKNFSSGKSFWFHWAKNLSRAVLAVTGPRNLSSSSSPCFD